jgi:hypothetical protein
MGKFEIQQAAVTFDHGQAVEFALRMTISERPKVAPVDLTLHAGFGFKADEGGLGRDTGPHTAEIVSDNRRAAVEAALLKTLAHDGSGDLGVGF